MNTNDYLHDLLARNTLDDDGPEMKAVRVRRVEIGGVLTAAFGSAPKIKYGGSKAKGTMVLASYDLDILCYFPRDEKDAGQTLEELYDAVATALEDAGYQVERKRSALRVRSSSGGDFHVDVVPGRYVDESETDVFLHQNGGDKQRLMTDPVAHVEYVRDSGCVDEIRLAKIWRERSMLNAKTFVLELAVIDVLSGTSGTLEERMRSMFEAFRDRADEIAVEDPANANNDLSAIFDFAVRAELADAATRAIASIDHGDWKGVFEAPAAANRSETLRRAAAASPAISPWSE